MSGMAFRFSEVMIEFLKNFILTGQKIHPCEARVFVNESYEIPLATWSGCLKLSYNVGMDPVEDSISFGKSGLEGVKLRFGK